MRRLGIIALIKSIGTYPAISDCDIYEIFVCGTPTTAGSLQNLTQVQELAFATLPSAIGKFHTAFNSIGS